MIYFKNVDFKTRDLSPLMIYSSWCASPAPSFMEKNIIKIMITKGQGTACTNIERNWKASPKRADLQTWEVKHPGRQSEKEGVTFPWVQYNGFKSFPIKAEKILKGSLDLIPSPSPSVKIQTMGRKLCLMCKGKTVLDVFVLFLFSKVCWHHPAKFCLITLSKLSRQ